MGVERPLDEKVSTNLVQAPFDISPANLESTDVILSNVGVVTPSSAFFTARARGNPLPLCCKIALDILVTRAKSNESSHRYRFHITRKGYEGRYI
jgi:hypothetical protein